MSRGSKEIISSLPVPIFQSASPQKQREAVTAFCQKLREITAKPDCYFDQQIKTDDGDLDTEIDLAIATYDMDLSDEVRVYEGVLPAWTDEAAVYYRSDAYKTSYPEIVIKAIENQTGIRGNFIIGDPDTIFGDWFPKGFTGMLTPELAFWCETGLEQFKPQPPYSIPRQEIYRSLLHCGINPLNHIETPPSSKRFSACQATPYRDFYKQRLALIFSPDRDILAKEEEKVGKHWGNIMSLNSVDNHTNATLFNSGASANEAVICLMSGFVPETVYRHPFWYYENNGSIDRLFGPCLVDKPHLARTMFVNLEPTNHFNLQQPNSDLSPLVAMQWFLGKASVNPRVVHYLVIDATVDPMFSVDKNLDVEMPDNVVLIKTLSATKHQDGGRNYFFGAVNFQSKGSFDFSVYEEALKEVRRHLGTALFPKQIPFFPLPSAEWLAKKAESVGERNKLMAEASVGLSDWYLNPYTYHSFIFPPSAIPQAIADYSRDFTDKERADFLKKFNSAGYDLLCRGAERFTKDGVQIGDSFGFPFTRINTQGGESCVDGVVFRLKLPRICPGYETDIGVLRKLARELVYTMGNNRFCFV